eukprot:scaffold205800_cov20-Prasinocladus_malaysianus.AAC.1
MTSHATRKCSSSQPSLPSVRCPHGDGARPSARIGFFGTDLPVRFLVRLTRTKQLWTHKGHRLVN